MVERHPLKKYLNPNEVADMAEFIISEKASSISGQIFNMDCGIVSLKYITMKYAVTLIIFLLINFGALGVGSWLMKNGPQTQWYLDLNKAPWSPPGWVFG